MNRSIIFIQLLPLLCFTLTNAQPHTLSQDIYSRPDSAKSYWILRAAATDQTPTVQFYNAQHQLLYQEILPASASRVDRSTRRALDKLLTNLITNRILTTTYLNQESNNVTAAFLPVNSPMGEQVLRHVVFRKGTAVLSVEPILNPSGELMIYCTQFSNRLIIVSVEDINQKEDTDQNHYFERRFKSGLVKCNLNLSQLPSGLYRLKVGHQSHPFLYRLLIDQSTQHYELYNETEWVARH